MRTRFGVLARSRVWAFTAVANVGLLGSTLTGSGYGSGSLAYGVHAGGFSVLGVTALMYLRPILGHAQLRPAARLLWLALTVGLVIGILRRSDVRINPSVTSVSPWLTALLGVCVCAAIASTRRLVTVRRAQIRRVEELLLNAMIAHLLAELVGPAGTAGSGRARVVHGIFVLLAGGLVWLATSSPDAALLGEPLDPETLFAQVSPWSVAIPFVLVSTAGGVPSALQHPAALVGAVLLIIGSIGIAYRRISGGYNPYVLPFTHRERAVHEVFDALVNHRIRLVGRPVRQSIDGSVVAIEAMPDWADRPRQTGRGRMGIREAAIRARLEPVLDVLGIEYAAAHAPAVRQILRGQQAWLSVPVNARSFSPTRTATPSVAEVANGVEVNALPLDGVTIRVDSWSNAETVSHMAYLREGGARIQVNATARVGELEESIAGRPVNAETVGLGPDIVTLASNDLHGRWWEDWAEARRGLPLIRHHGKLAKSIDPLAVCLSVDVSERPVPLGVLLSAVARQNADEYVRTVTTDTVAPQSSAIDAFAMDTFEAHSISSDQRDVRRRPNDEPNQS